MFEKLDKNSNIFISKYFRALAIYDHKVYDRSDLDILNGAQRNFIIDKLKSIGFKLVSGNSLQKDNQKVVFPKNAHIGSSPLDLVKYTKREKEDFLVLTPMQLFLLLVEQYSLESDQKLIDEVKELISKMPVNLKKIKDVCKYESYYEIVLKYYNEFTQIQEEAINSHLNNKTHIGML